MDYDVACGRCKARFLHHGARKNHEKFCTNFDESPIKFADPDTLNTTPCYKVPKHKEMDLSQRNLELSFGAHDDSAIEFEHGHASSLVEAAAAPALFSSFSSSSKASSYETTSKHKPLDISLPSLLSPEAYILAEDGPGDDKAAFLKSVSETVREFSTVMKEKLKANGLRSKLELELLNFVGTRMLPQTVGDGMVSMLHRTGVTSSKDFKCRRTFKSMWKQIKLKALKEALISTVDSDDEDSESKKSGSYDYTLDFESEAVQKAILSSTLSFRKKSFTFADEYLSQPVLINYLMADPKSVCDYFIEKAVRSCLINKGGFPVKSEKNGNQRWGEFWSAEQWWTDLELLRDLFRLPDLQSLPLVVFIDGTSVTSFGRSLIPIYVCSAFDSFEERNRDKKLVGFFPSMAIEMHINTRNTSNQASVRRRFRTAFFNDFLGYKDESDREISFDYQNQTPRLVSHLAFEKSKKGLKISTPFIMHWLVMPSDLPEGNASCGFTGTWNSANPCRFCMLGQECAAQSSLMHRDRDLDEISILWNMMEVDNKGKDIETGALKDFQRRIPSVSGFHTDLHGAPGWSGFAARKANLGLTDDEFERLRPVMRLGYVVNRTPTDFLHTMMGLAKFVFHNFILLICQTKLVRTSDGKLLNVDDRLNLLNSRFEEANSFRLFDHHGKPIRKFSGSLTQLATYTHSEVTALIPKLLHIIGDETQLFLPASLTGTMRKVLVTMNTIVRLHETYAWTMSMRSLLQRSSDSLGDQLRELCYTLPRKSKSVPDWVIKVHNLRHWSYFISLFGSLKNFDVQTFECEHKIYKLVFDRTTRTKGKGLVETETMEYTIVRMYIQRLYLEYTMLLTAKDCLEDGILLPAGNRDSIAPGWLMKKTGSAVFPVSSHGRTRKWRSNWTSFINTYSLLGGDILSEDVVCNLLRNALLLGNHQRLLSVTFHSSARAYGLLKLPADDGAAATDERNVDVYADGSNTCNTMVRYNSNRFEEMQHGTIIALISAKVETSVLGGRGGKEITELVPMVFLNRLQSIGTRVVRSVITSRIEYVQSTSQLPFLVFKEIFDDTDKFDCVRSTSINGLVDMITFSTTALDAKEKTDGSRIWYSYRMVI